MEHLKNVQRLSSCDVARNKCVVAGAIASNKLFQDIFILKGPCYTTTWVATILRDKLQKRNASIMSDVPDNGDVSALLP